MAKSKRAYKDSLNKSIGKSTFHIVFGRASKLIVDLVALPDLGDKSVDDNDFVDRKQELHEQVKKQL